MNIILWRHAEAEEGNTDLIRSLTNKGQQQAELSAAWLQEHLPETYRIWVSQAFRSQQTATYLNQNFEIMPILNPDTHPIEVLYLLQKQTDTSTLVLVGHQPWLGQLCSYLLNGVWQPNQNWTIKKGAFWWLNLEFIDGLPKTRLKAMLSPAMLKNKQL